MIVIEERLKDGLVVFKPRSKFKLKRGGMRMGGAANCPPRYFDKAHSKNG